MNIPSISEIGNLVKPVVNFACSKNGVITMVAIAAIASIPLVEAAPDAPRGGAGTYLQCISMCREAAPDSWITAVLCPVICLPFLKA
jgi:hypothetical protein